MKINSVKTIKVTASKSYQVIIGSDILGGTGERLLEILPKCKIAVITDDRVDKLYSKTLITSLENSGYQTIKFVFKAGEESKNLNTYGEILAFLAENGMTRTDAILALGGGVVGDMAGFASATYMRGIKYVQIPTTLLAQIDSSVGGKTAVDLPQGKNLVGAFCQPSLVLCDVDTLKTLPKEVYLEGMGEGVKYAVLDKDVYKILSGNYDIEEFVYSCVDYKRRIVEADEFEGGKRKLLNFGHTPAHGIEKLSEFKIPHGNAVAMGVKIMLENSLRLGYIDKEQTIELVSLIEKVIGKTYCPYKIEEVMKEALMDKKRSGDTISIMMAFGIGDVREIKVKIDEIGEYVK
jgi:3-dehydroquinate synthase